MLPVETVLIFRQYKQSITNIINKDLGVTNVPNIIGNLILSIDKNSISDSTFLILNDLTSGVNIGKASISNELKPELITLKQDLLNQFNNGLQDIANTNSNPMHCK